MDRVDTEISKVAELSNDGVKIATLAGNIRIEKKAANVKLVNDHFVPGRRGISDTLKDIARIGDNAVAD